MADTPKLKQRHHAVGTAFISGAMAGAVAKTSIAPLDRTKIAFQVDSVKHYSFQKAIKFLRESWKNEGPLSLWRGNSATLVRIIPQSAIVFTSHEQWKHLLHVDEQKPTPVLRFLAGSLAGCTATACTYPLDTARARMAISPKCEYNTLRSVFTKIYQTEGLFVLYRGLVPTFMGSFIYGGVSFFTFETLKLLHYEQSEQQRLSPWVRLVFGATAGAISQTSSYPLDIVRRRLQTGRGLEGFANHRPGCFELLRYIARTEGIQKGLYKGLSMNWIKGPIAVGISFTTYDIVVHALRQHDYFDTD